MIKEEEGEVMVIRKWLTAEIYKSMKFEFDKAFIKHLRLTDRPLNFPQTLVAFNLTPRIQESP